jgi:hypothetical protein
MQSIAQAATDPPAELARRRIIPHPRTKSYRIGAWSECGKNGQAERIVNQIFQLEGDFFNEW